MQKSRLKHRRWHDRTRFLLVLGCLVGSLTMFGAVLAAPTVEKVDPPSWWTGSTINPVRLLIKGHNLTGARAEALGGGIRIATSNTGHTKPAAIRTSANGDYLFLDVIIDPHAAPGPRSIRLTTPAGATDARFTLVAPLPRSGRFQGFSPDDFIYELMPDRFSDGDPSNDDPPQSPGMFDRSKPRYYHGGDFQGIINHLPYLKDLGATALWMTPIYDNVNHLNERERYDG